MSISLTLPEQAFIRTHLTDDVRALLLRPPATELDLKKMATQIAARQKGREKLPAWYANDALVFPPPLSVEQASSEQTARYKASLVDGNFLIDATGGMGIDTWAFAQHMQQVLYIERQPDLSALAAHNFSVLNLPQIQVITADGIAYLTQSFTALPPADWLYLDPHRRNEQGGKVVRLADCEPDITQPALLSTLLQKAAKIIVKVSPLLDIDAAVKELKRVEAVHIIAVQGEVKEVLLTIVNQIVNKEDIKFNSVNLTNHGQQVFTFRWADEQSVPVTLSDPRQYVYEPNAAVLKAGAFRIVAARFGLQKLAPHSHLYTSDVLVSDFPGRIFETQAVLKPDAKQLRQIVPDRKANLTIRNFPQSVAALRKQLQLAEGGELYILATTLQNGDKRLIVTHKAKLTHQHSTQ